MAIKSAKKKVRIGTNADGDAMNDQQLLELVPGGLAQAFVTGKLHTKQLAIAGLGGEPDWNGKMPEVPNDIAAEDHNSLSNLLASLVNAYSTALWYASKSHIEAGLYEDIVEYLEAIVLLNVEGSNKEQREAKVITDGRVIAAKSLLRSANTDYIRFRDTAERLRAKHATVSRVGGFVGDEARAEIAGAIKGSTRGKSIGKAKGSSQGITRNSPRR